MISAPQPRGSSPRRFDRVMRAAERLAVSRIEGGTAVAQFGDMIGKEAVLRFTLRTAPAILDPFALPARLSDDRLAPGAVFRGRVDRSRDLRWRWHAAAIGAGDPGWGDTD